MRNFIIFKIFRRVKSRHFTLMPMCLIHNEEDMMYEVVAAGFWFVMITINQRCVSSSGSLVVSTQYCSLSSNISSGVAMNTNIMSI